MICACPGEAAIPDIPEDDCVENLGQIQRLGLQRQKNGTAINWIETATDDPELLATWVALKAALDDTKVQFTPFIGNPNNEAGGPRTTGGGNATPGGVEVVLGRNPSPFTAEFQRVKQAIIKEIKKYECEKQIGVFLLTESGGIACLADDPANITKVRAIPVRGFFTGDKVLGNFENQDTNGVQFSFEPNWSDNLVIITPADFDALSQL